MRLTNRTPFDNSLFEKLLGIFLFLIGGGILFYDFQNLNAYQIFATSLFFLGGGILEWQATQSSRDEHAHDMGMISPRREL